MSTDPATPAEAGVRPSHIEGLGRMRVTSDGTAMGTAITIGGKVLSGVTCLRVEIRANDYVRAHIEISDVDLDLNGEALLTVSPPADGRPPRAASEADLPSALQPLEDLLEKRLAQAERHGEQLLAALSSLTFGARVAAHGEVAPADQPRPATPARWTGVDPRRARTMDAVLAAIADGHDSRATIHAATGLSASSMDLALQRLAQLGEIVVGTSSGRTKSYKPAATDSAAATAEGAAETQDHHDEQPAQPTAARGEAARAAADFTRQQNLTEEVLEYVRRHGPKTSRQAARDLTRNASEVAMAMAQLERRGAVVRAGVLGFNAVAT